AFRVLVLSTASFSARELHKSTKTSSRFGDKTFSPTPRLFTPAFPRPRGRNGCPRGGARPAGIKAWAVELLRDGAGDKALAQSRVKERVMTSENLPSSGGAEAAHVMAMRAAEGPDGFQDWQGALDLLQRSAELGSNLAQAELAALAGDWSLSSDIVEG